MAIPTSSSSSGWKWAGPDPDAAQRRASAAVATTTTALATSSSSSTSPSISALSTSYDGTAQAPVPSTLRTVGTGRRIKVTRQPLNTSSSNSNDQELLVSSSPSLGAGIANHWSREAASPSTSLQSTPEMSSGSTSSPPASSSPFTPHRYNSSGTPFAVSSSGSQPKVVTPKTSADLNSVRAEFAMPSRDRPLFQHERTASNGTAGNESTTSGSIVSRSSSTQEADSGPSISASSSSSTPAAKSRRQLMPSIPTRRGSAMNESSSSAQSSPSLGNQTNIQNLAQAIAARAQHVAAAKAAAQQQQQNGVISASADSSSAAQVGDAVTPQQKFAPQLSSSAFMLPQSESTTSNLSVPPGVNNWPSRTKRINSMAESVASDYGDGGSDNEADLKKDTPRQAPVPLPGHLVDNRASVAESFRWSGGEWADYAAALSSQIDVGSESAVIVDKDSLSRANSVKMPQQAKDLVRKAAEASARQQHVGEPSKRRQAGSRNVSQTTASSLGGQPPLLSGLGIGGTDLPSTSSTKDQSTGVTSDVHKTIARPTELQNNPLLAHLGKTAESAEGAQAKGVDVDSTATTAEAAAPAGESRSRPKPLSFNATPPTAISPPMRSPSMPRSMTSPALGLRTPPPTMPPAEPLPPLPADTSAFKRSWPGGEGVRSSPASSTRGSGNFDASSSGNGHKRSLPSQAKNGDNGDRHDWKRASDPSNERSDFVRASASLPDMPRKNSLPQNSLTPASLAAQSVALAKANRASTIAEAQRATQILAHVQRELTYDEASSRGEDVAKRRRGGGLISSKLSEDQRKELDSSLALIRDANEHTQSDKTNGRGINEGKENQVEDEEEADVDAEAEQAIVTRVTARSGSIARKDSSASLIDPPAKSSEMDSSSSGPSIVGRARPRMERQPSLGTTGPVQSNDKSTITALAAKASQGGSEKPGDALAQSDPHSAIGLAIASDSAQPKPSRSPNGGPPSAWSGGAKPALSMAVQPQRVAMSNSGDVSISGTAGARSPSAASIHGQLGTWTPTVSTPTAFGGYEYPNGPMSSAQSASSHQPPSYLQSRRGTLGGDDALSSQNHSPIDRFKQGGGGRTTSTFAEISLAFKQLQAEKRTLEKIIRATTPLDGFGTNGDSLAEYLTSTSAKLDVSAREIRKLLDLLDQQRSVMDYMADTHQLELEAQIDEFEELKDDYEAVCVESETHRTNAIRLTEDLDKAHNDAIIARAESLKLKTTSKEEEGRREKAMRLLRQARDDLTRLQRERDEARGALKEAGGAGIQGDRSVSSAAAADISGTSADELLRADSAADASRITTLEKELALSRDANADLQKQLHEQQQTTSHANYESPAARSFMASTPLSDSEDADREKDMLRDKLLQQEKDISELRAQIALGAVGANGSSPRPDAQTSAGLPAAAREDQIKLLMAQMGEQRAREAQIRKAYRQLRDELRKTQSAQQQDRKRTQTTLGLLASGAAGSAGQPSARASIISTAPHSAGGVSNVIGLSEQALLASSDGATPRHLKRLSLPIVNKMAPVTGQTPTSATASFVLDTGDGSVDTRLSPRSNDDRLLAGSSTRTTTPSPRLLSTALAAQGPLLSRRSSLRGARNFSVDFNNKRHSPVQRHGDAHAGLGLSGSEDDDIRSVAAQRAGGLASPDLTTNANTAPSPFGTESSMLEDDNDAMENLRTPRQSLLHNKAGNLK